MQVCLDLPAELIKTILEGDLDLLALTPAKKLTVVETAQVQIAATSSIKQAFLALSSKMANQPIKADILVRAASPVSEEEASRILIEADRRRADRRALSIEEIQKAFPDDPFYQEADALHKKAILRVYENLPRSSWNASGARAAVESIVELLKRG
jgi:hypothetical protein